MSFTFPGHGVCSCPSKGCGVCLSTLIPTTGRCTSKQCVSKGRVWEPLIAKHLVIDLELSCECGVQASAYAPLRSQLYSLFCALQGNHPPGCEGHKVYWLCFAQSHAPTQACIDAGYDYVRGQNLVELAVMRHISHVSIQQLELIDN
jgi:hypothetical protein